MLEQLAGIRTRNLVLVAVLTCASTLIATPMTAHAQDRSWEWGWSMHPVGWMWGAWGFGMMVMMFAFWALLVAGVVLAGRWLARQGSDGPSDHALKIDLKGVAMAPLNWKIMSWSLGLFGAVSFVLCVAWGLVVPREWHPTQLLEFGLPGFRWISPLSFVLGLVESFVIGAYVGAVVSLIYNFVSRRASGASGVSRA